MNDSTRNWVRLGTLMGAALLIAGIQKARTSGPHPVKTAASIGSDVAGPWREAVYDFLGIDDEHQTAKPDLMGDLVYAGAALADQYWSQRPR